jgi:hypothetical protein
MKRIYSFITLMFLAIGSAWAGSYLYVLGEEIDVSNSWTRSASSFVSGATGTISYDEDRFVIKFTNVKIPGNNSKKVVHNKVYNRLKIAFEGECELYSMDKVIQYDASTTLDGSASTSVKMHSNWDEETLYSNESKDDGAADLTINGFRYLELWSLGDYCISHKYGEVIINDSHVVMEGDKGTIHSNSYATSSFSRIQLKDSFYGGNYTWLNTGSSRDIATATSDTKNEKVKKCVILRSSEYSGVRLNGEPILMSDSRWNASTSTVTLNAEVNASSNFTYQGAITAEKSGITIDGGGKNFYGRKYGMQVKSGTTITIRNMALNGYDAGLYAGLGKVTIGDNVSIFGVDYAINNDGNITFSPSSGKNVVLMPAIGYSETYYGTLFRNRAIRASSIQLNECSAYPEGITVSGNTFVSGSTPWQQQVVIKGWEKYDLWVNGTQVYEKNKDNLTSLLGSNATGTLKYNPSTNTLTMTNLKASPSGNEDLIHSTNGGLTIAVEGDNTITAPLTSKNTIYSGGALTITKGNNTQSKLTLNGAPLSGYSFIRATPPVIKDVSIYIEGDETQYGITNYQGSTSGIISNATVVIKKTHQPLAGSKWSASGVCCELLNEPDRAITFNTSTNRLVYCDDNGPTTNDVMDEIGIYPFSGYTLTVDGSKPQSYSSTASVSFDEFSRRLYLRNANCGRISATISKLRIHSIGDCKVTCSDNHALETYVNVLLFTGPGTLTLNSDNNFAARLANDNAVVQVLNTTLKMNGKNGMIHPWNSSATDNQSMLFVTNSRLEAHCPIANGFALSGFCNTILSDCNFYIPQGGIFVNRNLINADGTVAWDMLILPKAPAEVVFDAEGSNNRTLVMYYGQEVIAKTKNFTIKGDGKWRTICLPFDLTIPGSVLKNCEVREHTAIRQEGKVGIYDFTKQTFEIKANKPYLIRNTSGTDIVNPNFGVVKILSKEWNVNYEENGIVYYMCHYSRGLRSFDYVLEDSPLLVYKNGQYTLKGFEFAFGWHFVSQGLDYFVVYTGKEDDLIDGIQTVGADLDTNEVTYDLSGRRIGAQPTRPGIYIKNGKKIAVK